MKTPNENIISNALLWSMLQNWAGKFVTFGLTVLLARMLTPEDFGVAASIALVVMFGQLLSEFGMGDAIVQRQNMQSHDANLSFYVSISVVTVLAFTIFLGADIISASLGTEDLTPYLVAASVNMVISVTVTFQESFFRRSMKFKMLAIRGVVSNVIAGMAAISAAYIGLGVWSFIIQAYVVTLVSIAFLWSRPEWKPTAKLKPAAFLQMARVGLPMLAHRLFDFIGTRYVEFLILSNLGAGIYGLYVVGSRLNQTLMQLLFGAVYPVALSALSKISKDRDKVRSDFLRSTQFSSLAIAPVFMMLACLAPDICSVLYGKNWDGVDLVVVPLMLLAAVQSTHFLSSPFLTALGKPEVMLIAMAVKMLVPIVGCTVYGGSDVVTLTSIFALCQATASPVEIILVSRQLKVPPLDAITTASQGIAIASIPALVIIVLRKYLDGFALNELLQGIFLGSIFCSIYIISLFFFRREFFSNTVRLLRERWR